MTTSVTRAFAGLVLCSILVAGCSSGASEDPGGDSPGAPGSSTSAAGPSHGGVGSASCPLDRQRLSFVVRDWGRAFGSIGRPDHPTYTRALVSELAEVARAGAGCDGSAELAELLTDVRRIDTRAHRPRPSYPLYDAASRSGNAWLAKVGYGHHALSVG